MTGFHGIVPSSRASFKYEEQNMMDFGIPTSLPAKAVQKRRVEVAPRSKFDLIFQSANEQETPGQPQDYKLWVAIAYGDQGMRTFASPAMRQYRNMILDPEAMDKFQHVVDDFVGMWSAVPI
jgi:hypothetical protein